MDYYYSTEGGIGNKVLDFLKYVSLKFKAYIFKIQIFLPILFIILSQRVLRWNLHIKLSQEEESYKSLTLKKGKDYHQTIGSSQ